MYNKVAVVSGLLSQWTEFRRKVGEIAMGHPPLSQRVGGGPSRGRRQVVS